MFLHLAKNPKGTECIFSKLCVQDADTWFQLNNELLLVGKSSLDGITQTVKIWLECVSLISFLLLVCSIVPPGHGAEAQWMKSILWARFQRACLINCAEEPQSELRPSLNYDQWFAGQWLETGKQLLIKEFVTGKQRWCVWLGLEERILFYLGKVWACYNRKPYKLTFLLESHFIFCAYVEVTVGS